jgi:hypothetical protein
MAEKILFTGKTHTTGGKDGYTRSSDGGIDIKLPEPHPTAEKLFGRLVGLLYRRDRACCHSEEDKAACPSGCRC